MERGRGHRVQVTHSCPSRARSTGQRRELTVTPGQPDASPHQRIGRLTRCANRPSKLVILLPMAPGLDLASPPPGRYRLA
jgi:hypothetical protein